MLLLVQLGCSTKMETNVPLSPTITAPCASIVPLKGIVSLGMLEQSYAALEELYKQCRDKQSAMAEYLRQSD